MRLNLVEVQILISLLRLKKAKLYCNSYDRETLGERNSFVVSVKSAIGIPRIPVPYKGSNNYTSLNSRKLPTL